MANRKAPEVKVTPDPESETWRALPWRKFEQHVYRIQKRIYRASQHDNARAVQKLQKLLMKSEAARLLAVRRVTQDNQGKRTAGIDGIKSVKPKQRFIIVSQLHPKRWKFRRPRPVRRVWIPKPGKANKRPLGIPVMSERAQQALVKLALEPEWEAKFEPNSYGFRPGRSAHDAIAAIFLAIRYKAKFVFDADIKGCFDNINHVVLLQKLHTFPTLSHIIKGWLKAGVLEGEVFTSTEAGTPQGGVISPLLANIALHGLEKIASTGVKKAGEQPFLIRYADDFIILHSDKQVLDRVIGRVTTWLQDLSLQLSPEKTRVTHTLTRHAGNVGFDFLGFTVRQFSVGKTHTGKDTTGKPLGFKTIIKPSKQAIKTHVWKTNQEIKRLGSASQALLIKSLNPIIRGWSNYYKTVVAAVTFVRCDHYLYSQLRRWSKRRHPCKGKSWRSQRYWHREGNRWVFATPIKTRKDEYLLQLRAHSKTAIQRYIKVRGNTSPYDGNLLYWSQRLKDHPLMASEKAKLLKEQKGRCPRCGLFFRDGDLLEVDHIIPTVIGGKDTLGNKAVYHRHCHDEKTAQDMQHIVAYKAAGISIK